MTTQPSNEHGFINLKDLSQLFIKSKTLILLITLSSTLLSAIYSHSLPPTFITTAKIDLGTNSRFIGLDYVTNSMNFYYDAISISKSSPSFLKVAFSSNNAEAGKNKINNIIDYIKNLYSIDNLARAKSAGITKTNLNSQINTINSELTRLANLQKLQNSDSRKDVFMYADSRKDVFMSELSIEIKNIQLEINEYNRKENTSTLKYQIDAQVISNSTTKKTLLGFLAGLLISFMIVIVKSIFLERRT